MNQKQQRPLRRKALSGVIGLALGLAAAVASVAVRAGAVEGGSSALRLTSNADGAGAFAAARVGGPAGLRVGTAANGFACQVGQWGVQDGVVKCAVSTSSLVPTLTGKTVFVRANLVDGFVSGSFVRMAGSATDIRLDMLDLNGQVVKTCYLTVVGKDCDLGTPSVGYAGLANDPRYPYWNAGAPSLGNGALLVSTNARFGGSLVGGPLNDSYIVSVGLTATGIRFHLAGLYWLTGRSGLMTPVYSTGEFASSALAAAPSGTVFVLPTGWAAPF